MLRGQLNRYRYIFDINRLPYSVACITFLIVLTKTLQFWYLLSKNYRSNTINVLFHVSAASFPSVRDFTVLLWQCFKVKYQNGNVLVKTMRNVMQATLYGKRFMPNMYLYRFNCPLSNDCGLVTYANGRGSAVLTY